MTRSTRSEGSRPVYTPNLTASLTANEMNREGFHFFFRIIKTAAPAIARIATTAMPI